MRAGVRPSLARRRAAPPRALGSPSPPSPAGPFPPELRAACEAVRLASLLCVKTQDILASDERVQKTDDSPVTVADFAAQALVSHWLALAYPDVHLVAEETAAELRAPSGAALLGKVTALVNDVLTSPSPASGPIDGPLAPLTPAEVADAIDRGASEGGPRGRHWILDPIDGTKGFVAGRQYAVALALMDHGDVALGVLGCPNMPWAPVPRTAVEIPTARPGVLFAAHRDRGCVVAPLDRLDPLANVETLSTEPFERRVDPDDAAFSNASSDAETPAADEKTNRPRFVRARRTVRGADACYMESWGDSVVADHGGTARLAAALRITRAPVRIDSMAKYGALARGDADLYLRFPPASYREKVWDHAAGVAVVRAAGGVVTDGAGNELDFARGRFLEIEDGIVGAATEELHAELLKAIREGKANDE